MAHVIKDRVKETSTSTGTGDFVLGGAGTGGFSSFSGAAVNNGDTFWYAIENPSASEWEVGQGTYNSGPNSITRSAVYRSSAGFTLVNFSAGTKNVFITLPADRGGAYALSYLQASLPTLTTADAGTIFFSTNHFGDSNGRIVRWTGSSWRVLLDAADIPGGFVANTPSGKVNNYNPTGLSYATGIRLAPTGATVITGLDSTAFSGLAGTRRLIANVPGSIHPVVLAANSPDSTVGNRFNLNQHVILWPGDSIELVYDSATTSFLAVGQRNSLILDRERLALMPGSGTAPAGLGLPWSSNGGTISHPATASTDFKTRNLRTRGATGTTAGTQSGGRVANSVANAVDGFIFEAGFGFSAASTNGAAFVGLASTTSALGNVNPTTLLNLLGVGRDPTQTTLRLIRNDGSGVATATDLGASYPATSTTATFYAAIYKGANPAGWSYVIYRMDSQSVAPLAESFTTDIPTSSILAPHYWVCNRTDATDNQIEILFARLYRLR